MLSVFEFVIKFELEVVNKRNLQLGGEEVIQCGHFSDKGVGGSSDADVRTFMSKKLRNF